jgi:hypothetical protein
MRRLAAESLANTVAAEASTDASPSATMQTEVVNGRRGRAWAMSEVPVVVSQLIDHRRHTFSSTGESRQRVAHR